MKIGLALGGGSLRGAAHIGVLNVLLSNGIVPDLVAGTSAGSIVAALYGAGMLPLQMEQMALRQAALKSKAEVSTTSLWKGFWQRFHLPLGLIPAGFLEGLMEKILRGKTFEALRPPVAIVAADLHDGLATVFTSRELIPAHVPAGFKFLSGVPVAEAVHASTAIPGIFTPRLVEGRTMVDGGIVDNVPADVLRMLGAEKVIAVDLNTAPEHPDPFQSPLEVLLQVSEVMNHRIVENVTQSYANLVIRPSVGSASLLDFHKIPSFIAAGKKEAADRLPEILQIIKL